MLKTFFHPFFPIEIFFKNFQLMFNHFQQFLLENLHLLSAKCCDTLMWCVCVCFSVTSWFYLASLTSPQTKWWVDKYEKGSWSLLLLQAKAIFESKLVCFFKNDCWSFFCLDYSLSQWPDSLKWADSLFMAEHVPRLGFWLWSHMQHL